MGIVSNEDQNQQQQDNTAAAPTGTSTTGTGGGNFSGADLGAGPAPGGQGDFAAFQSRFGISRIDSTVEPYLEKVTKLVRDALGTGVTMIRMNSMGNGYAYKYDGADGTINFFGILFVSASDPIAQQLIPASARLSIMAEEIKNSYANQRIRIADARIIIAGYEADMAKFYDMADTIVRTLQVTSIPELKNAKLDVLTTNDFVVDWRLSEARSAERQLSAHGIAPRMDIGLTVKAKIKNPLSREFRDLDAEYRTLGVIGGYTEIREREEFVENNQRVLRYRPVFNITVCNATIPLEGVAAILLACLAPTIYSTLFWARQWQELGGDHPNPGLLEADPDNRGKPYVLKDQEELLDFVRTYFAAPVIAFQLQDGRDSIPGMYRLASNDPSSKAHFMHRLTEFFGVPDVNVNGMELCRIIETRYDGAYGDPSGVLHDSREIDYLQIAAKNGYASIDANTRRILLGGNDNPTDRARIVANVTNSFIPLWLDTLAMVNPDFVKWIISTTDGRRLVIVDPNSQGEARSLGSLLDGFGTTTNMGSVVSSGYTNRGLGLNSVWNNNGNTF